MELPNAQFLAELVRSHSSADNKLSWEELCAKVTSCVPLRKRETVNHWGDPIEYSDDKKRDEDNGRGLCMSRQILARLSACPRMYVDNPDLNKILLSVLRYEDAIHIPFLRIDTTSGVITDWNRAMTDLTGLSKSEVVGRTYEGLLNEWELHLSREYKSASVEWIEKEKTEPMEGDYWDKKNETKLRGHCMFPLPLPIKEKSFSTGNDEDCWYIELLACRVGEHMDFTSIYRGQVMFAEYDMKEWNAKTSKVWIGGPEFTLRRKKVPPSPRSVTALDGQGMAFGCNSSEKLVACKKTRDVYEMIADFIRSCPAAAIEYLREVLYHVRMAMRKEIVNPKKAYNFSKDFATMPETAEINRYVLKALGGEKIVEQTVSGGKMTWRLAFATSNSKKNNAGDFMLKYELDAKRRQWSDLWKKFLRTVAPAVGASEHSRSICATIDTPNIIPGIDHPEYTLLTLKIEGVERTCGSDLEEPIKAWATVQVPATLNFFQLHRVINQTMNCSTDCTRETHVWEIQNIAPEMDSSGGQDGYLDLVQLGENYFVEDGKKATWNEDYSLFGKGAALRQRISRTAVHYDQYPPLYYDRFRSSFRARNSSVGKISACIHSTCISAVFYQVGSTATLQNGLVKYSSRYKVSCSRIDEYKGQSPENPNINIMLPKCLRGKNEDEHHSGYNWSVQNANIQLEKDRGCLRRKLCQVGTKDCMQVMPWCFSGDYLYPKNHSVPLAASLKGTDFRPVFLLGEPPLPESSEFQKYVSTLEGRIDPCFLQENVNEHGDMSVPFKRGIPGSTRYRSASFDEDEKNDEDPSLGKVWEKEVDEEMKRMKSLNPKKKAKAGKKRKADLSA